MDVELINEDCLVALKKLPDNSISAVVTDPPAGISFMSNSHTGGWDDPDGGYSEGPSWDHFDSPGIITDSDPKAGATGRAHSHGVAGVLATKGALEARKPFIAFISKVFTEVFRVLKPGAYGLVWGLPRTSHWTAIGLEDAQFEVREIFHHLYGTGYPKTRTSLKPSAEHWILIRKPGDGTIANNIWKHGVGALHVDACKVGGTETVRGHWAPNLGFSHSDGCERVGTKLIPGQKTTKRPPDLQSPTGWGHKRQDGEIRYATDADGMETVEDWRCVAGCAVAALEGQAPGVSRLFPQFESDPFLYTPKAPTEEKQAGVNSLYWKKTDSGFERISFVDWVQLGEEERAAKFRLRDDLTPEQVAYVEAELIKAGVRF